MNAQYSKYHQENSTGLNTGSEEKATVIEQNSSEVKLGQLEVALSSLKEGVERDRKLRLWIIGTVLAIAVGIIGGLSFFRSVVKDNLDSYKNLQKDYYQSLNKSSSTYIKDRVCLSVSEYYWQYRNCLEKNNLAE